MNCAECIDFWLCVCRSFSKRKPIFYYYLMSELDVPTFCWFPWADVPSASISFLYLSDSFLFSLKLGWNVSNYLCFFKGFFGRFFFFISFFHPLAMLLLKMIFLFVLVLVIYNYYSNIVIHVYRFSNKLLII